MGGVRAEMSENLTGSVGLDAALLAVVVYRSLVAGPDLPVCHLGAALGPAGVGAADPLGLRRRAVAALVVDPLVVLGRAGRGLQLVHDHDRRDHVLHRRAVGAHVVDPLVVLGRAGRGLRLAQDALAVHLDGSLDALQRRVVMHDHLRARAADHGSDNTLRVVHDDHRRGRPGAEPVDQLPSLDGTGVVAYLVDGHRLRRALHALAVHELVSVVVARAVRVVRHDRAAVVVAVAVRRAAAPVGAIAAHGRPVHRALRLYPPHLLRRAGPVVRRSRGHAAVLATSLSGRDVGIGRVTLVRVSLLVVEAGAVAAVRLGRGADAGVVAGQGEVPDARVAPESAEKEHGAAGRDGDRQNKAGK